MYHCHRLRLRALLVLNTSISPTPKCYPFLRPLILFSSTSDQQSFTVSYLTNNRGMSPQAALKASRRVRLFTPQRPDSVIAFFRNHGFSTSQIQTIIVRSPELFVLDPIKTILPKFEFLASKEGVSVSDIVITVTRSPQFLRSSLRKHIIPTFDLVRRFCPSDKEALYPTSIGNVILRTNVKFLLHDVGVSHSNIQNLLRTRPSILCSTCFRKVVEEVKGLGFDPTKSYFSFALLAKMSVTKSNWDAKVDAFKTWGFSQDAVFHSFRRHPNFMLRSPDKLNAVMRFWIDQLGWDPSVLLAVPGLFGYSLEKRLIPRASVVQYLLSKGLMKKDASLVTPFCLTDKLFLQKYVKCFEEETPRLLRLYQGGC